LSVTPHTGVFVPGNVINFEATLTDPAGVARVLVEFKPSNSGGAIRVCPELSFEKIDAEGNEVWTGSCTVADWWPKTSYEVHVFATNDTGNISGVKAPGTDGLLTIASDISAPEVVSISASQSNWQAKETITLSAVLRDQSNITSVHFHTYDVTDDNRWQPVCDSEADWGGFRNFAIGALRVTGQEGLQTWEAACRIPEYVLNGRVQVVVWARDSVGNQLPMPGYGVELASLAPLMPEFVAEVGGGQDDTVAPTILSLSVTPSGQTFEAGESLTIEMVASDDTGIVFVSGSWRDPSGDRRWPGLCSLSWAKVGTTDSGDEIWQTVCTIANSLAGGQWTLEVSAGDYYSRVSETAVLVVETG